MIAQLEIMENAAAIRIQAAYRGSSTRRMVDQALEAQLEEDVERRTRQQQKKR